MTHFKQRCKERGIVSTDLDLLAKGLRWAIKNKREDLAEFVMTTHDRDIYRFRTPDGIFYVLVDPENNALCTVYSQDMMRGLKDRHKKYKKKLSGLKTKLLQKSTDRKTVKDARKKAA